MKQQQILIIWWGIPLENLSSEKFLSERFEFISEGVNYNPFVERVNNWKKNLWDNLWDDYEVIKMMTPNSDSAVYLEWKSAFEKTLQYLDKDIYIIWHSLWAIFILQYMLENNRSINFKKIFLFWCPLNDSEKEILGSFGVQSNTLNINTVISTFNQKKIYFYASKDDEIVDFSDFLEYKKIFPSAQFREYSDLWHFNDVENIQELLDDIRC